MKRFLFLAAICLMPILFYACNSIINHPIINHPINVGKIQSVTKDVTNFNGIDIRNAMNADITISDIEEVIVEAGENLHPYIVVEVVNNVLKIYYNEKNLSINGDAPKIHIKMKDLRTLKQTDVTNVSLNSNGFEFSTVSYNISGASKFSANNLRGNKLDLKLSSVSKFNCSELIVANCDFDISGASEFSANNLRGNKLDLKLSDVSKFNCSELIVANCDFDVSGASKINVKGTCDKLELDLSGASSFAGFGFVSQYADLKLSGASEAELTVEKEFTIEASGASRCNYKGNPIIRKMDITGASSVKKN
jgi:predicted small metal-binding protein